jgi:hypothetical protein
MSRLPDHAREASIASNASRNVLLSKGFVGVMARSRPYLGLEILRNLMASGRFFRENFLALYITELLSHRTGIFYSELANNCNSAARYRLRYLIPSENRLLHFLFADAMIAKELEVWKPVGEFMLRELDQLARESAQDPYNQAYTGEDSWEKQSSLFAPVHFFRIMVSEALFQGIDWHMWLYYTTYTVKKIVRNYRPADDPLISPEGPYPIWYSRLLHEIFSALDDWILGVQDVPSGQSNVQMKSIEASHDNGNIPKSSILALGDCLHSVLSSDSPEEAVRNSLVDHVLWIYFELRGTPEGDRYAEALLKSVVAGASAVAVDGKGFTGTAFVLLYCGRIASYMASGCQTWKPRSAEAYVHLAASRTGRWIGNA